MIYVYIGAMLAAVVLIVFAVLAIVMLTKAVGYSVRRRTAALMEAYDEQLERRARTLREQQQAVSAAEPVVVSAVEAPRPAARSTGAGMELVSRLADTQYRNGTVGEVYRQIRSGFHFTVEDALQRIPWKRQTSGGEAARRAAQALPVDTVCAMASLTPQQQYELLQTCGEDMNEMLAAYTEKTTVFSCIGFYEYLHQRAEEETGDCTLYVVPGAVPTGVPEGITVRSDSGLCEGFLLETAGTVYDYSLRVREIS